MTAGLLLLPMMRSVRCPALEAEVLDVGRARLADPQAVQSEQHGESGMGLVDPLGSEQ